MLPTSFRFTVSSLLLFLAVPLLSAQETKPSAAMAHLSLEAKAIAAKLDANRMRAHLKFLASDLLEGRGTGQRGGEIAAEYVATQFELAGLKPAAVGGSYFQPVPLVGIDLQPSSTFAFVKGGERRAMTYLEDYVAAVETQRQVEDVDAEMVFVGYGIEAPEYQWNDYKDADVRGKVLVMLVNDPPSEDPKFFGGKALTYYGRWTYKYEIAARKGAVGAVLIHTTPLAGYAWAVVRNSWGRERPYVRLKSGEPALAVASWITEARARALMEWAGQDLDKLMAAAAQREFRPVPLGVRLVAHLESKLRPIEAVNVVGLVEGSDPKLKDQVVVYTAHYDHLGIGTPVAGDAIYNGAQDNASGSSLLLELARVFAQAPRKPRRSVLFISVAAEEGGLRGSEYYAAHPLIPPGKTASNINYDGLPMHGRTRDVGLLGVERTSLYPAARRIARAMGLTITADSHPEQGYYYRSDQFSLAKVGIPAISVRAGLDYIGKPPGWGQQKWLEYQQKHYHQPSDEYDPSWDFSGAVQMGTLGIYLGWEAAQMDQLPTWNPGDEFAAAREHSLSGQ